MNLKELFAKLGAPKANDRWSWGAVRSDGSVFLQVWQDAIRVVGDRSYIRLEWDDDPDNLGFKERLKHIALLREHSPPCYLVMCQAADVRAEPRAMKDFNSDEVFTGEEMVTFDGDTWIALGRRIPVRQVPKPVP